MTKEEIQKNSEHWYNKYKELEQEHNKLLDVINNQDVKIADLEQKLEQTEKDLADYQFNYPKIKELEKENQDLRDNYEDFKAIAITERERLQKENAELRDDNKVMADNYSKMEQKFYNNLTKATEILKRFIETSNPIYFEEDRQKVKTQAEQFLKEIEK